MRVAVHQTGEAAVRAAQILLAERSLDLLGLVDRDPRRSADDRVVRADDLSGFDVVVTDNPGQVGLMERAVAACVNVCIWPEFDATPYHETFIENHRTLLAGANLASGIAPCLAAHETARGGSVLDVTVAWTEPGSPLRRGEAIPFPDPVGARWGKERTGGDRTTLVAPVSSEWAAALAKVTSATDAGVVTRIVGVADLASHLEALALAAGVMAVADGAYPFGAVSASDAAEPYLAAALGAGLGVAAYSLQDS